MQHDLKIEKCYFEDILSGNKTWELRNNDRGFRYGDTLILHEIDYDGNYTGRTCRRTVKYVHASVRGTNHGLCEGYCIMSIDCPKNIHNEFIDSATQIILNEPKFESYYRDFVFVNGVRYRISIQREELTR